MYFEKCKTDLNVREVFMYLYPASLKSGRVLAVTASISVMVGGVNTSPLSPSATDAVTSGTSKPRNLHAFKVTVMQFLRKRYIHVRSVATKPGLWQWEITALFKMWMKWRRFYWHESWRVLVSGVSFFVLFILSITFSIFRLICTKALPLIDRTCFTVFTVNNRHWLFGLPSLFFDIYIIYIFSFNKYKLVSPIV